MIRTGPQTLTIAAVRCTLRIQAGGGIARAESLLSGEAIPYPNGSIEFGDTPQLVRLDLGATPAAKAPESSAESPEFAKRSGLVDTLLNLAKNPDTPIAPSAEADRELIEAIRRGIRQAGPGAALGFRQTAARGQMEIELGNCRMIVDFVSDKQSGGGVVVRTGGDTFLAAGVGCSLRVIPRPDGLGPVQIHWADLLTAHDGALGVKNPIPVADGSLGFGQSLTAIAFSTAAKSLQSPSQQMAIMTFLVALGKDPEAALPGDLVSDPDFARFRDLVEALRPILKKHGVVLSLLDSGDGQPASARYGQWQVSVTPRKGSSWKSSGGLVIPLEPDLFLVAGAAITTEFTRPEDPEMIANTLAIDELIPVNGSFTRGRRINGDEFTIQVNNGPGVLRMRAYNYPKTR